MTKHILAAGAAVAALALPLAAQAQQRTPGAIAVVVDTSRIYTECNACKTAQAQLKSQADAIQARSQALAGPLQTESQAIQAAINALQGKPADAALQARVTAFQQKQQAAQAEIQGREQTFTRNRGYVAQQINVKLNPIVVSVMKARGANLAVDPQNVLAYEPSIEVTSDVLTQLNTQLPSVSTTAPAAPATPAPTGR
ncbi:MAG: OmpH family outer membrane protein [Sphingomonadaceae bacterium]|nr:OmpH family outer membrane protein [Sphingomonadaceae bacterium]